MAPAEANITTPAHTYDTGGSLDIPQMLRCLKNSSLTGRLSTKSPVETVEQLRSLPTRRVF